MLDSGDNEFIYKQSKDAIQKGVAKFTLKDLQEGFSKKEINRWEVKK